MTELVSKLRSAGADGDAIHCWNLCVEAADEIECLKGHLATSMQFTADGVAREHKLMCAIQAQGKQQIAREQKLKNIVEFLWNIIDDIDSESDVCKADNDAYRRRVEKIQKRRWETGITTDGYTLNIPLDVEALK